MSIVETVLNSTESDFYKKSWGVSDRSEVPEEIPILTRKIYAEFPFLERLYHKKSLLTKIAYLDDVPFLIGRHLDDIGEESYGTLGDRPLIAFSNVHDSLEKSLWCYTRNILPLINDTDDDITAMLAKRYEADSLVTDSTKLVTLLPSLANHYDLTRFKYVSVVDTVFNLPLLRKMFPDATVSLILGLSETGGIATACPEALEENRIVFHPAPHRVFENTPELTFTDDRLLPTPLIRYRPGLAATFLQSSCSCEQVMEFTLHSNPNLNHA